MKNSIRKKKKELLLGLFYSHRFKLSIKFTMYITVGILLHDIVSHKGQRFSLFGE